MTEEQYRNLQMQTFERLLADYKETIKLVEIMSSQKRQTIEYKGKIVCTRVLVETLEKNLINMYKTALLK